jgi:hypothetical protein
MRKSNPFDERSDTPCRSNCGAVLKQRIVDQKPTAQNCFKCYKVNRNQGMSDAKAKFYPCLRKAKSSIR